MLLACLIACGFILAAGLAVLCNAVALRPWRRSIGRHWAERARLLYPARASAAGGLVTIPAICLLAASFWLPFNEALLVALAALPGVLLGNYPLDRAILPELTPRRWLGLVTLTGFFQTMVWVVPVAAAVLMPAELSPRMVALVLVVSAFNSFVAADGWFPVLRWTGLLRPVPAELMEAMRTLAASRSVTLRNVWVLEVPVSNAFASVVRREIGFTSRFLERHPEAEVMAVAAHELGHLTEPFWARAGRWLTTFLLFPLIFLHPATSLAGIKGAALVLAGVLALLGGRVWLTRRMEKRADAFAVVQPGEGEVYARALARLYEDNQLPAVMPKRNQLPHPHLYDRLLAAGMVPDFPRPAPASARSWPGRLLGVLFAGLLVTRVAVDVLEPPPAAEFLPADGEGTSTVSD